MLHTREELLLALTEAAELEHMLACQYLFAKFSLKQRLDEVGNNQAQLDLINGWRKELRGIALQEMGHLATVHNLLAAIGGAAHFNRPNFPQPARYYGPQVTSSLEPFSLRALKRFVEFERKDTAPPVTRGIAPVLVQYKHVGELYGEIRQGFLNIDKTKLFFAADAQEDTLGWGAVEVHAVIVRDASGKIDADATLKKVTDAIDAIVEEGEGTDTAGPTSHYQKFFDMVDKLKKAQQADPSFDPARQVVDNPWVMYHRDAVYGTIIENVASREMVELFNALYGSLLLMFTQYYAFADKQQDLAVLQAGLIMMMQQVLSPLGAALTELPAGDHQPGKTAGAGFEMYGDFRLATKKSICWPILLERLEQESAEITRLQAVKGTPVNVLKRIQPFVNSIHDKLKANL